MEWRWACKLCGELLDDSKAVMIHWLQKHQEATNYAVAVPTDRIPAVKMNQPAPAAPVKELPLPPAKKLGRPPRQPLQDEEEKDEEEPEAVEEGNGEDLNFEP
jgi:hypothetical protein